MVPGRNDVDPRFVRLFNVFCVTFPPEDSIKRIYATILETFFEAGPFPSELKGAEIASKLTTVSMNIFNSILHALPPTPAKVTSLPYPALTASHSLPTFPITTEPRCLILFNTLTAFVSFITTLPRSLCCDFYPPPYYLHHFASLSHGYSHPSHLPPFPYIRQFHYIFNLRDLSRITEGVMQATPDKVHSLVDIVRQTRHEVLRVFYDRLVSDSDRSFVADKIEECLKAIFPDEAPTALVDPILYGEMYGTHTGGARRVPAMLMKCFFVGQGQGEASLFILACPSDVYGHCSSCRCLFVFLLLVSFCSHVARLLPLTSYLPTDLISSTLCRAHRSEQDLNPSLYHTLRPIRV